MTYTTEQIEAMAACLREIKRDLDYYTDDGAPYHIRMCLKRHGIRVESGALAPWLQPPDDSVALDHPKALDCGELELRRSRVSGKFRYLQWVKGRGLEMTNWHPTEEAARREWNAICRRAAK